MRAQLEVPVMPTMSEAFLGTASAASSLGLVWAMSLVIALCAQISVPLPFTPVPLTGTTLGVLYAGAFLGPSLGVWAVILYLLEGALGLPFFAGGAAGLAHFAGPTGGYLLGFAPAAWVTGRLARRGWDREPLKALAMMLVGSAVIFAFGLVGLWRFVPSTKLLAMGFFPFIPGDIAKSCFSAALLPWGWKLTGLQR
jgi:biotin transport system substrate-specific component